ncbi:MAG: glycosyltransferase [Bacteroidetes bacterium]|nr:glycosyltransferase [Bacteroidota bacterium]
MKIVHVIEPFASGVAFFVKSLAETMPDDTHIVVHGERKEVMSAAEVKKLFPRENVRFVRWKSANRSINPIKDLKALRELYIILRRLKENNFIDAVHLHSSKSGFLGRLAGRMAGIRNVIYTPHGASFLSGKNILVRTFYRQLEKLGSTLGGKIVCCSESEFEAFKKIGIKASFINNGVSISNKKSKPFEKDKNRFTIVTSGRIVSQKNPALFNEIAHYFQELSQFEFVWIGDGDERGFLASDNIKVTGWQNEAEVRNMIENCDVYLSTSQYEGLSFTALHALSYNKPVLLSNCVGNRDVVIPGMNGDLFDNKDQAISMILKYYNNKDMLSVMGEYSRELCEQEFDRDNNYTGYRDIYKVIPGGIGFNDQLSIA